MTARERIDAAIAARDKATPGPWEVVFIKDSSFGYVIYGDTGDIGRLISHSRGRDLRLIAAAPDLVDEVIRLRKWQQEAVRWLGEARIPLLEQIVLWSDRGREEMYRNQLVALDRLIAEAQDHLSD